MRAIFMLLLLVAGCAFDGSSLSLDIDENAESRCEVEPTRVSCDRATVTFATGAFGWAARDVHVMHPVGEPPETGWPAAILFQGSLHPAEDMFEGAEGDAYGGLHQAELVAALLDAGFVVLAPEARYAGTTFWDTNVPPYSFAWDASEDHQLMVELFAALERGDLGPIDVAQLHAAGISSGGYMTSRMAVSYPGRFRALAIQSASYATCSGVLCDVPELPTDHPPTLFLHGAGDEVVPTWTAEDYAEELSEMGVETRFMIDDGAGHEWLSAAPDAIVSWFSGVRDDDDT